MTLRRAKSFNMDTKRSYSNLILDDLRYGATIFPREAERFQDPGTHQLKCRNLFIHF